MPGKERNSLLSNIKYNQPIKDTFYIITTGDIVYYYY